MVANKALIFTEVPNGWPVIGQDLAVKDIGFDLDATPAEGQITVEVLYSSFDPYMRGRMRAPGKTSYGPGFTLGKPMDNHGVGKVLKSNAPGFAEGDVVRGMLPIAQYATVPVKETGTAKVDNPHNLKLQYFLGPLGMPGETAYSSLYEIGKPKRGETIFISAASGAVGQIVGQLAKHEGLRVIGSVGSQEKLDFITKELGFDGGFNYKTEKPGDALKRLAPEGIDIYYDNVGAEQLEAALQHARDFGRFIMCGAISQYNLRPEEQYGVKGLMAIVAKRLLVQGFIVADPNFGRKWGKEHAEKVGAWIADGTFKVTIHETDGIDKAAEGLMGIFKGENFGKAVLKVKQ